VQEGGAGVKIDPGVTVENIGDPAVPVQPPGKGEGGVAFAQNALVPVAHGCGARFDRDAAEPGVLARRLIKMPVYTEGNRHVDSREKVRSGKKGKGRKNALPVFSITWSFFGVNRYCQFGVELLS
jgi:hypothetical protein